MRAKGCFKFSGRYCRIRPSKLTNHIARTILNHLKAISRVSCLVFLPFSCSCHFFFFFCISGIYTYFVLVVEFDLVVICGGFGLFDFAVVW